MRKPLSRRHFVKSTASCMAALGLPSLTRSQPEEQRPNILVLLADDLRYDAVGYLNERVHTPHLNRLAAEGLRFRNMFVTTPICATSRASIFTGMYARRHGICDFGTPLSADLRDRSYPVLLRNAGYRTGLFGKFGVGDFKIDATGRPIDAQLSDDDRHAFDVIENYGFSYHTKDRSGEKSHIHQILSNRAEDFITSTPKDQPFCLSLSFVAPHEHADDFKWSEVTLVEEALPAEPDLRSLYEKEVFPPPVLMSDAAFESLPEFIRASFARTSWSNLLADPEKRQQYFKSYYALVTGIDRVIGRIVQVLEDIGQMANTAILFTSDNGLFLGDYQLNGKWFGYEPSIRVPLMIRLPGKPMSRDITGTALNIDIAPTLLGLGGVSIPSRMQGKNLERLWTGNADEPWRKDFLFEHFMCDPSGRPLGPEKERRIPSSEGVRDERYTYLRYPRQKAENESLYDRMADPSECMNIIRTAPRALVERYRRRVNQLIEEIR